LPATHDSCAEALAVARYGRSDPERKPPPLDVDGEQRQWNRLVREHANACTRRDRPPARLAWLGDTRVAIAAHLGGRRSTEPREPNLRRCQHLRSRGRPRRDHDVGRRRDRGLAVGAARRARDLEELDRGQHEQLRPQLGLDLAEIE
jgi:hypothetical protein